MDDLGPYLKNIVENNNNNSKEYRWKLGQQILEEKLLLGCGSSLGDVQGCHGGWINLLLADLRTSEWELQEGLLSSLRRKAALPARPSAEQRPQGILLTCSWAFPEYQWLTRAHSDCCPISEVPPPKPRVRTFAQKGGLTWLEALGFWAQGKGK